MLKDSAIPIRLDAGSKERLKAAADRLGLTTSALIRILIASFVESYEASGGRITLPLEWSPSPRPAPLIDEGARLHPPAARALDPRT